MPSAPFDLDAFLPYRLSVLSNRISQSIAQLYAEQFQISITEWRVLAVLGRYSGLSANELAERTAMDKVAVSRALARLVERGLISRSTHDDDRRRSVLSLSASGKRIHAQIAPLALQMERKLLAGLSRDEKQMLDALLDKLAARLT
ncbi:MarR family transcriptional regulator [Lysobacteraceae bacterium NML120232]|nr:MarR family transcriptional regulator [Xanthomonadaceae bacterium NML08-0793]PJK13236.1 MarR family transcriptional regulator [Xanthomonadaceae bacterium NML120232]